MSRRRAALPLAAAALVALVAVGAVAVGGGGDGSDRAAPEPRIESGRKPASDRVAGAVGPARHTGPQGRVGQFVVGCAYSHSGPNDPIVHPDHAGASHRHDFYGATETDERSTAASMVRQDTTCDKKVDTAGYWHPTLYDHGEVVEPLDLNAYYRAAPGVDPADVEPFPLGLALIAGDATATEPQPGEATGWTCGTRTTISDEPPTCPASAPLHLVLTYQDCWDGRWLDSEDHRSHAAYSDGGRCPASHPVHLPQLTVSVRFPIWGEDHELSLASGNVYSAHGDFLNAWDPEGLAREIRGCLHRDVVCDLGSNRGEEALFVG